MTYSESQLFEYKENNGATPMTLLDEIKSGERLNLEFKQKLPQDARGR